MISTHIYLPAYTDNNSGQLFKITMDFTPTNKITKIDATGEIVVHLLSLFTDILTLFTKFYPSTKHLLTGHYQIYDSHKKHHIIHTESAGLGIAIGIFSLARKLNNSTSLPPLAATGCVMANGNIERVGGIYHKKNATLCSQYNVKKLITPNDIKHIAFLYKTLLPYL